MVVIGSFLPWATVSADTLGTVSFNGMNGDGLVTLILGGLIAVIALVAHSRARSGTGQTWLMLLSALAIAIIGFYDFANISSIADQAESGLTDAAVGVGLYAVVAGGIGLVFAGMVVLRTRPDPPPAEGPDSDA